MTSFGHHHVGPAEEVIIDRFLSVSFIAAQPAAQKAVVEDRLRRLVAEHPQLRGREQVMFPYRTEAYCCRVMG